LRGDTSSDAFEQRPDWEHATVVSGDEWRRLTTSFLDELAPEQPLQGVYYQAFLADGVVYRDADGVPRLSAFDEHPADVEVCERYSLEETLELSAEHFEKCLRDLYPGRTLFVLMTHSPRRVISPVLLDIRKKRCVWLIPAALQDSTEKAPALSLTLEAASGLLPEAHGVALLKNPVSSAFRLADLCAVTVLRWAHLRLPRISGALPPLNNSQGMDLAAWERWLDEYTGTRQQPGSLKLLIDGEQFFTRMQEAFHDATNKIDVQMFIFDRDDVALEIADQLKQRSSEIPVRVIYDRLGSISGGLSPPATPLPAGFVAPTSISTYLSEDSRVKVRSSLNPWLTHNHSKLVLVDGRTAWVGGMNFGREYRYEWHDTMVEIQGPVVKSLQRDFRRSWAHAGPLGDLAYLAVLLSTSGITNPVLPAESSSGVRLLPTRTAWKPFAAAVSGALRMAQNRIYVENPYLFDKRTILQLAYARRRGVDVRVVLPRVNDFKPGERAALVIANYLLANGVRVYFYPGMTHTKALLADGWVCLGSGNMNHLSLRVNHELNVGTGEPEFVGQVEHQLFEADFARSLELREPINVDLVDLVTNLLLEGP
jgi:phosphatidylserine/phosphatidylglycerophosphate/cardiolipin synthase-like enzyme